MKKLKLNLDEIKIESFETVTVSTLRKGTINGEESVPPSECNDTCTSPSCFGDSCGITCSPNTTCVETCQGNTCIDSCYPCITVNYPPKCEFTNP